MPYAPNVNPDLAGQYLMQAITQAGQSIGKGIEALAQKSKDRKRYLGMADAMKDAGAISEAQREAMNNLGTHELMGQVEGALVARKLKDMDQNREINEAQRKALVYGLEAKQREEQAGQRFNEVLQQRLAPRGPATAAAGALTDPNTLMLSQLPQPAPAVGPVNVPAPKLEQEEIYRLGAQAGMPIHSMIELAKANERYGVPGQPFSIPGRPDLTGIYTTPHSAEIRAKPTAVLPGGGTITPSKDVAGLGVFTDAKGNQKVVTLPKPAAVKPDVELEGDIRRLQNQREKLIAEKAEHLEMLRQGDTRAGLFFTNRKSRVEEIKARVAKIDAELGEKLKRSGKAGAGGDPLGLGAKGNKDPLGLFKK